MVGFLAASVPVRSRAHPTARAHRRLGLALMVLGFGAMQYVLDRGEREDWFESGWIVALSVIAVCALAGFIARELLTDHPVLDFSVFSSSSTASAS
jgi:MFS transporter, DHA2 family, multidrug resistance protein